MNKANPLVQRKRRLDKLFKVKGFSSGPARRVTHQVEEVDDDDEEDEEELPPDNKKHKSIAPEVTAASTSQPTSSKPTLLPSPANKLPSTSASTTTSNTNNIQLPKPSEGLQHGHARSQAILYSHSTPRAATRDLTSKSSANLPLSSQHEHSNSVAPLNTPAALKSKARSFAGLPSPVLGTPLQSSHASRDRIKVSEIAKPGSSVARSLALEAIAAVGTPRNRPAVSPPLVEAPTQPVVAPVAVQPEPVVVRQAVTPAAKPLRRDANLLYSGQRKPIHSQAQKSVMSTPRTPSMAPPRSREHKSTLSRSRTSSRTGSGKESDVFLVSTHQYIHTHTNIPPPVI